MKPTNDIDRDYHPDGCDMILISIVLSIISICIACLGTGALILKLLALIVK